MTAAIHPSLEITWIVSNEIAHRAQSRQIEPIHLYIGVLTILDEAYLQYAERMKLTPDIVAEIAAQAQEGHELIDAKEEEITKIRRTLRKELVVDEQVHITANLHRSKHSKDLFQKALSIASEQKAPKVNFLHLFRAMLLNPTKDIFPYLPKAKSQKPELFWETRINEFVDKFHLTRITIILTDMVGSTAIKQRFGDLESAKIFRLHDNLVRDILGNYNDAKEIKTIGDAFLLAFSSETDAIRFSLQLQDTLVHHPNLSRVPVQIRIGVFSGEILTKPINGSGLSDPVFGITIDTATRIASLAGPNQILTDKATHDLTSTHLAADKRGSPDKIKWQNHGPYSLKGLNEPLEIFEVGNVDYGFFKKPEPNKKGAPEPEINQSSLRNFDTNTHATPFLDLFAMDITRLAGQNKLPPVVGRKEEIKSLARYLMRTSKRNVILIGEAGVGKSAIVEGFAQKIVSDDTIDLLKNLRILQINIPDLVSGTKHRGEMEERVKNIIDEAVSDPNVVLFLDEIHLIMNSGSSGDMPILANMLKPVLARGDLRCIGATTNVEFERYIKPDAPFMRRFQVLRISEPSKEVAVLICRSWAERIGNVQHVIFEPDAIQTALDLTRKLIKGRSFIDSTIDLLENAAVYVKVSTLSRQHVPTVKSIPTVSAAHIEAVFEEQHGISVHVDAVLDGDKLSLALKNKIMGQDRVIETITQAMDVLGERDHAGPMAIFLFTGPSGVGKTYTAEIMAAALFKENEKPLGRFNMNEYKERHELARLIGAPPGFVGHEQPGNLFKYAESNPQGLILLDEMEKAHPEIQDYFLQIFDKGEAVSSRGQTVDFKRHIFIMTCNLTLDDKGPGKIGFVAEKNQSQNTLVGKTLGEYFRPEFLGRIHRVLPFRALDIIDFERIFQKRFGDFARSLESKKTIRVTADKSIETELCVRSKKIAQGVRGFEKLFEDLVATPLYEKIKSSSGQSEFTIGWDQGKTKID